MEYSSRLGAEPKSVVRPASLEEAAAVVERAAADGKAVIPWGGGTGQAYGHLPRRADVVLDLSALNRITAYEPDDMTVTVQAGVTFQALERRLAAQGQFLPLDPPLPDRATIGGIIATDARGINGARWGTARDWLIGVTVIDARGRIIKGGGRVVKNVTGYDIPKLHIGALGTLGVIAEATFKVAPLPETFQLLRYVVTPGAPMADFLLRLHHECAPSYAVLLDATAPRLGAAPGRYLFVAYEGSQETVLAAMATADTLAEKAGLGAGIRVAPEAQAEFAHPSTGSTRLRIRFSGQPNAAAGQHDAIATLGCWEWVRTVTGTGETEAGLRMGEEATAAALHAQEWARQRPVRVTLLHAPESLRQTGEIWTPPPPSLPLMRRLKEALDPQGTLNPGRFVGRM